jgi:hypothetical protein
LLRHKSFPERFKVNDGNSICRVLYQKDFSPYREGGAQYGKPFLSINYLAHRGFALTKNVWLLLKN